MTPPSQFSTALKRAELLSTTGVFALGMGAGAWFGEFVTRYAVVLLVSGALVHAAAMYGKHRLVTAGGRVPPLWYRILYGLCWALLAMLAVWLVLSRA